MPKLVSYNPHQDQQKKFKKMSKFFKHIYIYICVCMCMNFYVDTTQTEFQFFFYVAYVKILYVCFSSGGGGNLC